MFLRIYTIFIVICFENSCLVPNRQCGGLGYTSQNNCCEPLTCVHRNMKLSQCLYIPPKKSNSECLFENDSCEKNSECCKGLLCQYSTFYQSNVCTVNYFQDNKIQKVGEKNNNLNAKMNTSMDCCQPSCLNTLIQNTTFLQLSQCTQNNFWPFNSSDYNAYGFATVNNLLINDTTCCGCYEMYIKSLYKKIVVQVINQFSSNETSADVDDKKYFFINVAGAPMKNTMCLNNQLFYYTHQNIEFDSTTKCNNLDSEISDSCFWNFNFLEGNQDFDIIYRRVYCPSNLVDQTQCRPTDDSNYPLLN